MKSRGHGDRGRGRSKLWRFCCGSPAFRETRKGWNCRLRQTPCPEGGEKVPGSADPRFPAGLPFPVPEIPEFVAFCRPALSGGMDWWRMELPFSRARKIFFRGRILQQNPWISTERAILAKFQAPKFEISEAKKMQFHTPSHSISPLDSLLFCDSGKIFQQFSRDFPGVFLGNPRTDPTNSHSLLEFSGAFEIVSDTSWPCGRKAPGDSLGDTWWFRARRAQGSPSSKGRAGSQALKITARGYC